jgi:dTDP-4-amino-4,6-dideoxygalactose transaminase
MYYLVTDGLEQRNKLIESCKAKNIHPVFHYLSLHKSPYYKNKYEGYELENSDLYTDSLVRLPLYYSLSEGEQNLIIETIIHTLKS